MIPTEAALKSTAPIATTERQVALASHQASRAEPLRISDAAEQAVGDRRPPSTLPLRWWGRSSAAAVSLPLVVAAGCRILIAPQAAAQRQGVRPRLPLAPFLKTERVGLILCFGNWLRASGCSGFEAFKGRVRAQRASARLAAWVGLPWWASPAFLLLRLADARARKKAWVESR